MACLSNWMAQATVTASLTAFLYEGFTYNAVYLGRVLPSLGRDDEVLPHLIVFNIFWGMSLWCYLKTSWADPGAVPEEWYDFVRRAGISLPIEPGMKEWQPGKATMCKFCARPRPERAHHCTICQVCILRLDHHCPWLNNCVGFNNHKSFLLTCLYALLACTVAFLTALPELIMVTKKLRSSLHGEQGLEGSSSLAPTDEIAFIVFGALAVFISMFLTPLLFFQVRMAVTNRTTIEDNYSNMSNPFDQGGAFANLAQIFGACGPDWLLPVAPCRPRVDGVSFPHSGNQEMNSLLQSYKSIVEDSKDDQEPRWTLMAGGESSWRSHYNVALGSEENLPKPSTLDYMLGCMQLDCEGDSLARRS